MRHSAPVCIILKVVLEELFAPDLVPKTSGGIFVGCERVFFGRNGWYKVKGFCVNAS